MVLKALSFKYDQPWRERDRERTRQTDEVIKRRHQVSRLSSLTTKTLSKVWKQKSVICDMINCKN